jgi:hypothetical protein
MLGCLLLLSACASPSEQPAATLSELEVQKHTVEQSSSESNKESRSIEDTEALESDKEKPLAANDETQQTGKSLKLVESSESADTTETAVSEQQANTVQSGKAKDEPNTSKTSDQEESSEASSPEQAVDSVEKSNISYEKNQIFWDDFFDNEKQDTPSDKFWDLKGKQVTIDGFMGEVLSLEGGWFLLIPEPGAECPFDNGDESYWNKIMIVFVKDADGLRFTEGPLRIKGELDVGIKVDESNYKTMFRLYDAKFERM